MKDEAQLRAAFKAGWDARNKNPGLKKVRVSVLLHTETRLVRDDQKYHNSIWANSAFRKGLGK
jgi:hypothetical protein